MTPGWNEVKDKLFNGRKAEAVRFTGSGGHGLITASVILAKAGVYDEMNVLQSQVYGAEARGGATKSETIIRDGPIYYPKLVTPDVLLALTDEGLTKYEEDVSDDGLIIYDSSLIPDREVKNKKTFAIGVPMWVELIKELGKGVAINIVTLGILVGITGIVTKQSLERAVVESFRAEFKDSNIRALKLAFEIAEEATNE